MKEIRVVLTMDCEPTTATNSPRASGPADWAQGERAVSGYFNIARSYGLPVTYFLHPEAAISQAGLFKALAGKGACLGLHLHPWKYSMWRHGSGKYFEEYGGLSEADQRSLLQESSGLWSEAIGHRPLYFRPGTFSANDAMFRALAAEGFRGGSCSIPGRVWPDVRAAWSGAEPDPHRASAQFRHVPGSLGFADVPCSVDFSTVLKEEKRRRQQHPDLRPDTDWPAKHGISYQTIAANILAQIQARAPANPVIVILTHNHFEYSDGDHAVSRRLKASLDAVRAACSAAGVTPIGATIAEVVDRVLSVPAAPEVFAPPESVRFS
jgi:hypothetical protein